MADEQDHSRVLEARQREIEAQYRRSLELLRASSPPEARCGDLCDVADSEVQRRVPEAIARIQKRKLAEIKSTLARKSFGYCLDCEERISDARLKAVSEAVRCRDCQETYELGSQRRRRSRRV